MKSKPLFILVNQKNDNVFGTDDPDTLVAQLWGCNVSDQRLVVMTSTGVYTVPVIADLYKLVDFLKSAAFQDDNSQTIEEMRKEHSRTRLECNLATGQH